jgi:hypothetical protein
MDIQYLWCISFLCIYVVMGSCYFFPSVVYLEVPFGLPNSSEAPSIERCNYKLLFFRRPRELEESRSKNSRKAMIGCIETLCRDCALHTINSIHLLSLI